MKVDTRLGSGSLKLKSSPRSSRTGATNARTQRTRQRKPRMEVKCVCLFAGARARMVGFKGLLYPPSPTSLSPEQLATAATSWSHLNTVCICINRSWGAP